MVLAAHTMPLKLVNVRDALPISTAPEDAMTKLFHLARWSSCSVS